MRAFERDYQRLPSVQLAQLKQVACAEIQYRDDFPERGAVRGDCGKSNQIRMIVFVRFGGGQCCAGQKKACSAQAFGCVSVHSRRAGEPITAAPFEGRSDAISIVTELSVARKRAIGRDILRIGGERRDLDLALRARARRCQQVLNQDALIVIAGGRGHRVLPGSSRFAARGFGLLSPGRRALGPSCRARTSSGCSRTGRLARPLGVEEAQDALVRLGRRPRANAFMWFSRSVMRFFWSRAGGGCRCRPSR